MRTAGLLRPRTRLGPWPGPPAAAAPPSAAGRLKAILAAGFAAATVHVLEDRLARAPRRARRAATRPPSSTTSRAPGMRRAYSSATASGWSGSAPSRLPTTRVGRRDRPRAPRARRRPPSGGCRAGRRPRRRGARGGAMRCRITVRTASRQRSSRVSGPSASRNPSGPPRSRPSAMPVPAGEVARSGGRGARGSRSSRALDPLGVGAARGRRRSPSPSTGRPRRRGRRRGVQHRDRVVHQRRVGVGLRRAGGRGGAVAAGVVGDDRVAGALEHARAVHHVAAGGRQAVQQQDGLALAGRGLAARARRRRAAPRAARARGWSRPQDAQAAMPSGAAQPGQYGSPSSSGAPSRAPARAPSPGSGIGCAAVVARDGGHGAHG